MSFHRILVTHLITCLSICQVLLKLGIVAFAGNLTNSFLFYLLGVHLLVCCIHFHYLPIQLSSRWGCSFWLRCNGGLSLLTSKNSSEGRIHSFGCTFAIPVCHQSDIIRGIIAKRDLGRSSKPVTGLGLSSIYIVKYLIWRSQVLRDSSVRFWRIHCCSMGNDVLFTLLRCEPWCQVSLNAILSEHHLNNIIEIIK